LVGIGLNITTNLAEAPEVVKANATSLAAISASAIDADMPARLLAAILRHFSSVLAQLAQGDRELPARWNELDLLWNKPVCVDVGTEVIVGRARGIDADGALCLDREGQTIRLFGGSVLR
jgi:BirA family biotin operon repressor/biotin-[acetyl-CoA-carboxylase] ligase